MNFPDEILYTKTHEWLKKIDEETALIGISDYAQSALGDILYVDILLDWDQQSDKGEA